MPCRVTVLRHPVCSARANVSCDATAVNTTGTQWTTGDALFCFLYVVANVAALYMSPNYPTDRGLGSLAAANTMFLVIPATRNNILTWFLGLSFDHIVRLFLIPSSFLVALCVVFSHFLRFSLAVRCLCEPRLRAHALASCLRQPATHGC